MGVNKNVILIDLCFTTDNAEATNIFNNLKQNLAEKVWIHITFLWLLHQRSNHMRNRFLGEGNVQEVLIIWAPKYQFKIFQSLIRILQQSKIQIQIVKEK